MIKTNQIYTKYKTKTKNKNKRSIKKPRIQHEQNMSSYTNWSSIYYNVAWP